MAKHSLSVPGGGGKRRKVTPHQQQDTVISAAPGDFKLLTLPAEMCNAVYKLVLVDDEGCITVDKKFMPPGFLQLTRQVRQEASAVYYKGNTFHHEVKNCDATLMLRFDLACTPLDFSVTKQVVIKGKPHWVNLKAWCKVLFEQGGTRTHFHDHTSKVEAVIAAATEIADDFEGAFGRGLRARWCWRTFERPSGGLTLGG